MFIIGITGSIGSGKSTVSEMFAGLGARIIDADKIAHRLMTPYNTIWWKLIEYYGQGIIDPASYNIDRFYLGSLVFTDSFKLRKLNSILHPPIIDEIKKEIIRFFKENVKVVVIDAPLLIETGLNELVDFVILVVLKENLRGERLVKRNPQLLLEDINQRIKYQMKQREKIRFADFIIDNNKDIKNTENQVMVIFDDLKRRKLNVKSIVDSSFNIC